MHRKILRKQLQKINQATEYNQDASRESVFCPSKKYEGQKTKKWLDFGASSSSTTSEENNGEMELHSFTEDNEDECADCETIPEDNSTGDGIQCATYGRWWFHKPAIFNTTNDSIEHTLQ